MKALVTGGSGFIGSTLIAELGTLGFEVKALLRKSSSTENLKGLKYQRVSGSLEDFSSLKKAVEDVDYVFHLAGLLFSAHKDHYFRDNAGGTENLARAVAEANPKLTRFVFVSSLAAGGPVTEAKERAEFDPDAPVSSYGKSKLEAEKRLLKFKDQFPVSVVRPPIVYGPKDKAIFTLVQTVGKNLMLLPQAKSSDGQKHYSTIHVSDLVKGIAQAALTPSLSGEVFYLSGDGVVTYEEMLQAIAQTLEKSPIKIKIPLIVLHASAIALSGLSRLTKKAYPLNLDKYQEIAEDYWICSNEKAKRVLGFKPEYEMSRGMAQTVQWYQKQGWIK